MIVKEDHAFIRRVRSHKIMRLLNLDKGETYTLLPRPGYASHFVTAKEPFTNDRRTLFARWQTCLKPTSLNKNPNDYVPEDFYKPRYTVYSYGDHFPMFIWDEDSQRWYGNKDRYSVTTSRHQANSQPFTPQDKWHPPANEPPHIVWLDTKMMIAIDRYGLMAALIDRAGGNPSNYDD